MHKRAAFRTGSATPSTFEIVGLAIFTPLATLARRPAAADMGMIGLISSTVALCRTLSSMSASTGRCCA